MQLNENTLTKSLLSDDGDAAIQSSGQHALSLHALSLRGRNGAELVVPGVGDWRKRGLDIVIASAGLLLLMPLMLMIAFLVKISSPGPAIYGHQRVGLGGKPFKCLKFRTMVSNGDDVLKRHMMRSEEARREWEATRKLKYDPRVTAVGAVLRSTSVDELPQLINVLRGEMSIVGPRPVVQDELRHYGVYSSHYCSARPGLTGLWQVSGRSDVTYEARVNFDRLYCENWSLTKDLVLIARTVPAVLSRKGTY
jgi:exopolysaccharide production protein ExoY